MSQKIQNLFDDIAGKYDLLNSLLSFSVDKKWRREAILNLQEDRFQSVLDLCAGTLSMSLELLKANPKANITAIDFSNNMLIQGRSRVPSSQQSRLQVVCGDVLSLPFIEEQFDAAMCAYGLRNLDDNKKGLAEVFRVLNKGGRFVILEFFKPDRLATRFFQASYAKFIIPIIGRLVSRHKSAYEHLRDSVNEFYTVGEYEELLKSVGFKVLRVSRQSGGISTLIVAEKP